MSDFTISQALQWASQKLRAFDSPAYRLESELLLSSLCGLSRLYLYLEHKRALNESQFSQLQSWVDRRIKGEPIQYLTGTAEFYGRSFYVTPDVLIPRPETEGIIDLARSYFSRISSVAPRFADIGTGSGVLAITLMLECREPEAYAIDLSKSALEIARKNARRLLPAGHKLCFMEGFLFEPLEQLSICDLDLIVSNPPYISREQLQNLPDGIRLFEPELALDGGEGGTDYHLKLIDHAPEFLRHEGMIALEISPEQTDEVTKLMADRRVYRGISVRKDYSGRERIVSAHCIK